jgi:dihydrofolate reductase
MIVSLIVAASENNVIGKNGQLLWNLPNDMKFFKNTTWAMPVIMGRKTFDALKGKPLPGRFNFVITHDPDGIASNQNIKVVGNLEESIRLAKETDCKEAFVIGGGQIYAAFMPVADRIYLTRIHGSFEGDTFFPDIDPDSWKLVSNKDFDKDEKHAYAYSFQVWEKD